MYTKSVAPDIIFLIYLSIYIHLYFTTNGRQ